MNTPSDSYSIISSHSRKSIPKEILVPSHHQNPTYVKSTIHGLVNTFVITIVCFLLGSCSSLTLSSILSVILKIVFPLSALPESAFLPKTYFIYLYLLILKALLHEFYIFHIFLLEKNHLIL